MSAIDRGVTQDEHGHLLGDLSCVKCQYNLRTLHRDAACPECGTAVGRSIEGNRLRYCDPAWLKQVWEGLNCFGVAVVAGIGFAAFMSLYEDPHDTFLIVGVALYATALGLSIYGFFKATSRDPARIDQEHMFSARRLARGTWLAALLTALLALVFTIVANALAMDQTPEMFVGMFLLLLFAGPVFLLAHAAGLAARLPNRLLVFGVWVVNSIMVLSMCLVALESYFPAWEWAAQRWGNVIWEAYSYLSYQMPRLLLLLAVLLVVLLVWYWCALSRAARFAWATWAGAK